MGQVLSEPVTAKDSASCQNHLFRVGSSCMQGWRVTMEDSHSHILSLPGDPGTAFFAVYDGHGGSKIAEHAGKNLHKYVVKQTSYRDGNVVEGLKQAFMDFDSDMLKEEIYRHEQAGSTAVAVVVKDNKVFCANVGDSRAVACVGGTAHALSYDHKPTNELEYHRITAAGGWVEGNRVNGNLALSRALGDFIFKRNEKRSARDQIVTAYPDVVLHDLTPDWEFIVIACDGIWDVMSSQEVVDYVRRNMALGNEPDEISEMLMMHCLAPEIHSAGLGCDNMTVVIIGLLQGHSYEYLSAKCAGLADQFEKDEQKRGGKDDGKGGVDSEEGEGGVEGKGGVEVEGGVEGEEERSNEGEASIVDKQ